MRAAIDFEQPLGYRPRCRSASSRARRGRAVPGSRAGRRRARADAWRRNGAARAASPSRAGRARRAAAPSRAARCAARAARLWRRRTAARRSAGRTGRARHNRRSSCSTCGSTGTMRSLLPLPVTVMASPLPRRGHRCARQPERLGNAQARAVEQRQHGGVAREHPGLALLAGAQIGVGHAASRRRSAAASATSSALSARARRRARRPCPCRCVRGSAQTSARRRAMRISERLPMPSARRAAMKARTSARLERGKRLERTAAPPRCPARKPRNWRDVAPIGLDRLRRHAPLGAKMRKPARDLRGDIGGRRSCRFWRLMVIPRAA